MMPFENAASIPYIEPLDAVLLYKKKDYGILKTEKWLMYIALTEERNINLERISSLADLRNDYVLQYVKRSLRVLNRIKLCEAHRYILGEVLKWSETAKAGLPHHRRAWEKRGYNLFVHNIGSAEIYLEHSPQENPRLRKIIHTLIKTHGLIGQYIRGETELSRSAVLYELVRERCLEEKDLYELVKVLNHCILAAVDPKLWKEHRKRIEAAAALVCSGGSPVRQDLQERLRRLRAVSIRNGEDFEAQYNQFKQHIKVHGALEEFLKHTDLWYVEAALFDFTFPEFVKIFLLIQQSLCGRDIEHLSFEPLMRDLYCEHDGHKSVNLFKKRILENYLAAHSYEDILEGKLTCNTHVRHEVTVPRLPPRTAFFGFLFSEASSRLIDFCMEAEHAGALYEKAVVLLFDYFGLRKDAFDRFYNEDVYLKTMNRSVDHKAVIIDYITGSRVLDIGPGGGALLDLITESLPDLSVTGVDISHNVITALQRKKVKEKRIWEVRYGDALHLGEAFPKNGADTVIFCSVLHELFSYIEYNGKKFNYDTLKAALTSAFSILSRGGRIIIRDGIMTEPEDQTRIIHFRSQDGLHFLQRYAQDFRGREIMYQVAGHNEVCMPVNDAMEFLYTYTWGEKSYVHEVNEQFGYFSPSGFRSFIRSALGEEAEIIELRHYLQEGYTVALSQKIEIFDSDRKPVCLPDSTCLIVIEKK